MPVTLYARRYFTCRLLVRTRYIVASHARRWRAMLKTAYASSCSVFLD